MAQVEKSCGTRSIMMNDDPVWSIDDEKSSIGDENWLIVALKFLIMKIDGY